MLLYLLQLVQALKYENFNDIKEGYNQLFPGRDTSISQEDTQTERTAVRYSHDILSLAFMSVDMDGYEQFWLISYNQNSLTDTLTEGDNGDGNEHKAGYRK